MGYAAPRDFTARLRLGDRTETLRLPAGLHHAYFDASGSYDAVTVANDHRGATACISELVLGQPTAAVPPQ
jgi:hypothetical protein